MESLKHLTPTTTADKVTLMNNTAITPITATSPWHASLTGKLTWTQIGALSQARSYQGAQADKRRESASEAYYRALGVA